MNWALWPFYLLVRLLCGCWLYEIELGATYWVFAKNPEEAMRTICEGEGGQSVDDAGGWREYVKMNWDVDFDESPLDAVIVRPARRLTIHFDEPVNRTALGWVLVNGRGARVLGCTEW